QEVPFALRRQPGPERVTSARVFLVDRLETDFERAAEDARPRRVEREDRVAHAQVPEIEAGLPLMALDVVLGAATGLDGQDRVAFLERFVRVEGERGRGG